MKLNTGQLINNLRTQNNEIFNRLSDSGKKSMSFMIVSNAYQVHQHHYQFLFDCLKRYRDKSGEAMMNHRNYKSPSLRLQHEIVCLVSNLLSSMPKLNIDKIANEDSQLDEKDKIVIREAYYSLNNQIKNVADILGLPCFATEKPPEDIEKSS